VNTTIDSTSAQPLSPKALVELILPLQPRRQSRLSILLRPAIAVPFAVAAVVFAAGALVMFVVAYVAALVSGRVPGAVRKFLLAYVRFDARLTAFFYFLVRRPPMRRILASSPARVDVVAADYELNRWAVLARPILVLPALALEVALGCGMFVIWVLMWICGLFTKQVPVTLHQVAALATRYRARTMAYMLLLTPLQPFGGLYGDEADAALLSRTESSTLVETTPLGTNEPDEAANSPEITAPAERGWSVTHAARVILSITIIVGAIGAITSGVARALQKRAPDAPAVLHQATYQLINHADNAIRTYSTSEAHCSSVSCRAALARTAQSAIEQQVTNFSSTYLFSPAAQKPAKNYANAVLVLAHDMGVIATTTSPRVQQKMINLTIVNDLFVALKFEHILLFPSQVHHSSSITKLTNAVQDLTQSYAGVVAKFGSEARVCAPVGCGANLAQMAANQIDALVTSFEANYTFPARTRGAQVAFDHAIRQVARNLLVAYVGSPQLTASQQVALFESLSSANLRKIVSTEHTFINELNARS
jgi:hypothetical protein